jgi:flagellin-like protein
MHVIETGLRRWRSARKRAVDPIVATILLVAIAVVLAAVLFALISGLMGSNTDSRPIGSAFAVGPVPTPPVSQCTAAGGGCLGATDYTYSLMIASSSVTFGDVLFEVKTISGSLYSATTFGGFTILNATGGVAASYTVSAGAVPMAMPSGGFTTWGGSAACGILGAACGVNSPLTNVYTLVIDMGTKNPSGLGLTFTVLGVAGYSGTTGPLTLT